MALELILQPVGVASLAVQLDVGIASNSQGLVVSGEGVVGDWAVEEMVNLGAGHFCMLFKGNRSSSLLSQDAMS